MTETITVRLSEEERQELKKHGKLSEVVRRAIRLYLQTENSKRVILRLKELERTPAYGSIDQDLRLIRADRQR